MICRSRGWCVPLENHEKSGTMASRLVLTEAANTDRGSRCYLREEIDVLSTHCRSQQLPLVTVEECATYYGIVGIPVLLESLEESCARCQGGEPKIKVASFTHLFFGTPRGGRRVTPIRSPCPRCGDSPIWKVDSFSFFFMGVPLIQVLARVNSSVLSPCSASPHAVAQSTISWLLEFEVPVT
jgi:hypothetical protein